jgi:hypothetical protein
MTDYTNDNLWTLLSRPDPENEPLTGQARSGRTAAPNMVELMMILCFRTRRA